MGHTPGPWTVHPWGDNEYEINAALDTVCNVPGFDDDTVDVHSSEANANLIAAAPELLAALKRRAERRDAFDDDEWQDVLRLIAKAERRSK